MSKGMRLDFLLEEQGYFSSRQIAKTAIMDGGVLVNGVKVTKPGTFIKDGAKIELTRDWLPQKYVSRGGLKLEKAIQEFKINVIGKVCLDVGASTGGFTDCLLKSGAEFVYAVDVGYGQIAWSLRTDERVKVIERTNARLLSPQLLQSNQEFYRAASLAVVDVSFISLIKVLPAIKTCLEDDCSEILALIKPQFEAGPENVGKGGVVKSSAVHTEVISRIIGEAESLGIFAHELTFSPLKGPKGNIEFFVLFRLCQAPVLDRSKIELLVNTAASCLA